MHVESRVRPGEHALGRLDVHQFAFHEHLEHCAAERFGQCRDVMERQVNEGAVWAKTAVGDKKV